MEVKSEIEVKVEELDCEYDSYQLCSQNLSGSEPNFSFVGVKIEEFNEKESIKSELTESVKESISDEELVMNDDTKSENLTVFEMKSSSQLLQNLVSDAGEAEEDSKVKNPSRNRDEVSVMLDENIKKSPVKNVGCKFCNFSFKSKDELKNHLKTHNKRFKCPDCSYESNFKCFLVRHLVIHSNIKFFKCSVCTFQCNRKENLKTHMLTHEDKCSVCNFECSDKEHLKIHMLTHRDKKLFKCDHCSYECNFKYLLKRHMVTHHSIKLFKCDHCSYECNLKYLLKRHMLTHNSIKLFKCSECSYECVRKDYLKSHMLIHGRGKEI